MKKQLIVFALIISFGSCKTTTQASRSKHTLGEVSWSDGAWTYLDLDRATFVRLNNSNYLSETHPLTVKAKEWVDRLHHAVVEKHPEQMRVVPTPQIIVMKKDSADAFAARRRTVSYQLKTKISPVDDTSLPLTETRPLYFNESNKSLSHNIFPPEISILVRDPVGYSAWFSKIFAPCTMERTGRLDIEWAYGPNCRTESYLKPSFWSPEFVTQAAPNWVIITSGLFEILPSEESFAAIIAHELAHYYRAHVVKDVKHYNHCYLLDDPEHKPVERQELRDLCRDLKIGRGRGGMEPALAAAKVGLGVYTIEEEADELALEILSLTGIEPIKATDAWFALFEHADKDKTLAEVPLEKCRELFRNNWRDESGNHVSVPIGDYQDNHHSWCFRIFNTTNEIKIHKYEVKHPLYFNPSSWETLKSSVKKL